MMSIFLSGGPILEPMIGMACATVSCIIILIFSISKFLKSEKYKLIKKQSISQQWIDFTLIILLTGAAIIFIWFILTFVFAGFVFGILK